MAQVFQMIATNEQDKHFEPDLIDGLWHTALDAERTLCGIQIEGDDGVGPGPTIDGTVTCHLCLKVVFRVQEIVNSERKNITTTQEGAA